MAEKFVISGGKKLSGEVEINGSKNAAAAVLAAVLLTKQECVFANVPLVSDILNLLDVLKQMGADVEWLGEREVKIRAGDNVDPAGLDFEKFSQARTSVLLIGPLLTRFKEFKVSRPGGDKIGLRPITTHLLALKKLNVEIKEDSQFYYFKRNELCGSKIVLPEFSVTATENLLMAASLASGKTIIHTAAQEPHVRDLIKMLQNMGVDIKVAGSHKIEINGAEALRGVRHKIISDYIEAGTFLIAGAVSKGKVLVKNAAPSDLEMFLAVLENMGVEIKTDEAKQQITVGEWDHLKPVKIQALPYPGFPTDLLPLMVPLLTQAKGKSLIHDPLYENRLNYVQELRKMGADIEIVDPHRAFVLGPTPLKGVSIESWDIRAGASLIVAGLIVQGITTINSIYQIDRGYEKIEERLQGLGADIKRISN